MPELRRATVRGFDPVGHTASVRLVGSRAADLDGVPVSRAIPAEAMLVGRDCVLVLFEATDPGDCMLVGVH